MRGPPTLRVPGTTAHTQKVVGILQGQPTSLHYLASSDISSELGPNDFLVQMPESSTQHPQPGLDICFKGRKNWPTPDSTFLMRTL